MLMIYTFKSFPFINEITDFNPFVLTKLKLDIENFKEQVLLKKPKVIIGIAKNRYRFSRFETKSLNIFHKHKNISKGGKDTYKLFYPKDGFLSIKPNYNYSTSFCNWTSYKIAEFTDNINLDIKQQFIHIHKSHLGVLISYLKQTNNEQN